MREAVLRIKRRTGKGAQDVQPEVRNSRANQGHRENMQSLRKRVHNQTQQQGTGYVRQGVHGSPGPPKGVKSAREREAREDDNTRLRYSMGTRSPARMGCRMVLRASYRDGGATRKAATTGGGRSPHQRSEGR